MVAPHPDDEAAGLAGTILLHGRANDRVTVAYATDGRAARVVGLGPDRVADLRRREALRAAELLGASRVEWLAFREGAWDASDLEARLGELLGAVSPHVLYAPSRVDFHPEHRGVARALARALERSPLPGLLVRVYQVQTPLTPVLVDRVADVTPVAESVRRVFDAYESQRPNIDRTWRMRRYAALYHGVAGWAEELWEMGERAYRRVHLLDDSPRNEPYRGLRFGAFSDPLAYGRGRRVRHRLRRRAG